MDIKIHTTKKQIKIEYGVDTDGNIIKKCCIKCNKWHLLDQFSENKTCFLGKHNWCKSCANSRVRDQRLKVISAPKKPTLVTIDNVLQRRCSKCGYLKCIEMEFDKAPSGFLGHDSECKECKRRRGQLYRRGKGIKAPRKVPILVDAEGVPTHRGCTRCSEMLPLDEFNKHNIPSAYLNRHPYCKQCNSERELIRKYGLTLKDKHRMYDEQSKSCMICKQFVELSDINIDHCHKTGKVRGLLCSACNKAIGLVKDDPLTCQNMMNYLQANAIADKHTK